MNLFKPNIYLFLLFTVVALSCSTDVKIGKGNYYERDGKIVRGELGGVSYIMLVTSGNNKYPLTVDFRKDMKPFFATKTIMERGKFATWHGFTDTTGNLFWSFGARLVDGKRLNERNFILVSQEDKRVLYEFSNKLEVKGSKLILPKDSIDRIIGWVRATE